MNKVVLSGRVENIQFDHEYRDIKYYRITMAIKRSSGFIDHVHIMTTTDIVPLNICVIGKVSSYNRRDTDKTRLIIYVQAEKIMDADVDYRNEVKIEGSIVSPPTFRQTPLGKNICDVMLAVNRKSGKTDYIPCIAWGRLAFIVGELKVGDIIRVDGRLQSREYEKKLDDIVEVRTAYELSIFHLD